MFFFALRTLYAGVHNGSACVTVKTRNPPAPAILLVSKLHTCLNLSIPALVAPLSQLHKSFPFNAAIFHSGPSSALDRGRSVISMGNSFNSSGDYRIEISGWGLDNSFFAERTELLWTADGNKQVQVHRALPEGAIVFVRLLASEPSSGSVPVAYRVQSVVPMDCNGRCQMRLAQLHPRSKESLAWKLHLKSQRITEGYATCRNSNWSWNTRRSSNETRHDENHDGRPARHVEEVRRATSSSRTACWSFALRKATTARWIPTSAESSGIPRKSLSFSRILATWTRASQTNWQSSQGNSPLAHGNGDSLQIGTRFLDRCRESQVKLSRPSPRRKNGFQSLRHN